MKLGFRISICVVGVVILALASSGLALFAAWETNHLMHGVTTMNLPSVRAAEELEIALLEQSLAVAGFLLEDGSQEKLADLDRTRAAFDHWSASAESISQSEEERDLLAQLVEVYRRYDRSRARAIDVFDEGVLASMMISRAEEVLTR